MYEIAICDDDQLFLSAFKPMLTDALASRNISCHLTFYSDPASLWQAIEHGRFFHLLFLDVFFEAEKGIRFAKFLRERNSQTDIVFMSSFPGYAAESYDAFPLHYLLKPIDPKKLDVALTRFINKNESQKLHFITSKGHLFLSIADILFFEIYGHQIVIHLENGIKESCVGTLKELEQSLPPLTFVRPHRSYLVNLGRISKISRYQILLSSGDVIPVSRDLYSAVLNSFIDFANQSSISF